ncbi:MAG: DUF502 domain-containing protein [Gammaproteobacteria bacterium]
MKTLVNTFLKGLLAFLPIFLTGYAVYAFGQWLNRISNAAIQWFAPDLPDVPGLGIVIGVIAICALGVLVTSRVTRWIYTIIETPLRLLPVIKDLYSALKQLTALVAPDEGDDTGQVVAVAHPEHPVRLVGLMMRSDVSRLDDAIASEGMVAVYFPMSYQIGGYTLFVPRAWVTPLDMTVEEAMRNALTGWVRGEEARGPRPQRSQIT